MNKNKIIIVSLIVAVLAVVILIVKFKQPVLEENAPIISESEVNFAVTYNKTTNQFDVSFVDGKSVNAPNPYESSVVNVAVLDINFDGKNDFEAAYGIGAYNIATAFFVQQEDRSFAEYEIVPRTASLEDDPYPTLGSVAFDPRARTLDSFFKGRGLGDIYTRQTYSFLNGSWGLVATENQNFLSENFDTEPTYYVNKVIDHSKNPPVTTTTYLKLNNLNDEWEFIEVTEEEALKAK